MRSSNALFTQRDRVGQSSSRPTATTTLQINVMPLEALLCRFRVKKIERLQIYTPYVRLSAGDSRTTKRILIITAYLPELAEIYQHYNFAKTQPLTLRNYWSKNCLEQ